MAGMGDARTFIAIDGGGTKTAFARIDSAGSVLSRISLGPSNPATLGLESSCELLLSGIRRLVPEAPASISGVFAGLAGTLSGHLGEMLQARLSESLPGIPVRVGSDILNVIYSVPNPGPCVAGILGTGSAVFAYDVVALHRFGGWGYLIGDDASGFAFGRAALRECLAVQDGQAGASLLSRQVSERIGPDPYVALAGFYAGGPAPIATLAPLVFEAARQGDAVAGSILRHEASAFAGRLRHAATMCPAAGERIVLAGGLTRDFDLLEPIFRETLGSGVSLECAEPEPLLGACAYCLETFR